MTRNRTRIVKDAAWVAYRQKLVETAAEDDEDREVDTTTPAPVVPGPSWYRSTLWPDAELVSAGNGGWWDDDVEPSGA